MMAGPLCVAKLVETERPELDLSANAVNPAKTEPQRAMSAHAAPRPKRRYLTDDQGNRTAVVLDIEDYNRILDELEELEGIRAYDEAKAAVEERIPAGQAFEEIERERR